MERKIENGVVILLKVFFVGLFFHFFLHTFVSFELAWTGGLRNVVRLWKELLVLAVFVFFGWYRFFYKKSFSLVFLKESFCDRWKNDVILRFGLISMVGVLLFGFFSTIIFNRLGLSHWLVSLKYNFFPFFVFFAGYILSRFLSRDALLSVVRFVGWMITLGLMTGLLWYGVISTKPGTLKYFGYDPLSYEGTVGESPPASYLAHYDHGLARNQFLFERPISRGFYLIAFWPLFFVFFLQRKSLRAYWFPWLLYVSNVALTFSRAARGAFLFQIIFLLVLTYWIHRKRILFWFVGVCGALLLAFFSLVFGGSLLDREFSDRGHVTAVLEGGAMFFEKPILGHGGSSVGPGSHQFGDGFNPENQYLQVAIEYGALGFVFWILFYVVVLGLGWKAFVYLNEHKKIMKKRDKKVFWIYIGLCVGLLGLMIEGMVLHSFSDRMIIYPLMMFLGIFASKLFYSGMLFFDDWGRNFLSDCFKKKS